MSFDPEIVMAYVDGELDLVTAKRIEKAMESDPLLAARVEAERRLREKLSARFDPVADEAVPERLTAMLANVDTSLASRREEKARRFGPIQWAAMAASLAIGLFAGQANWGGGQVGSNGGTLVAQAGLKAVLDAQLASAQAPDAPIRIGLTFKDKAGAVCRTFEGEDLAGIACREDGDWQLRQTVSGEGQSNDYRQAGSGAIVQAAEAMIADEPFDAADERNARDSGWKTAQKP